MSAILQVIQEGEEEAYYYKIFDSQKEPEEYAFTFHLFIFFVRKD